MTLAEQWRETITANHAAARTEVDVATLVRSYSTLLFRVAHSVLRNRGEAEDTVQDVFVRVLERRDKLAEVQDMRVWLVRIAWNLALDRRRRIRPEQMDAGFAETLVARDLPADQALAEGKRTALILAEIDRLPAKEREVLLLAGMEELSTAALAEVLGRSESATRALLFRARTRLKERLAKGGKR